MKKMFSACTCALLVCALFFAGLLCMGEVQAETALQKPAIPEFTLRFVDNSYDVPPTFSKDPFTGKNEMTQEGYH
ncbi:hypothetical protein, partial [Candidatus Bathycorpusculum sp.]|uniref:hypothetical protein n=1 Tax=Candidatus Bathycorpusculum sp. TaxID=2994959 RepID=UPI002833CD80|nr:hypothetical protein [Candidatus Termitimicrobium sp.]MCL2432734.1 hypothetical protein [Candidatus Termitimicrobium sp.]